MPDRPSDARVLLTAVAFSLLTAVNVGTWVWCRSLEGGDCIPIHLPLTLPLNLVAAIALVVHLLRRRRDASHTRD